MSSSSSPSPSASPSSRAHQEQVPSRFTAPPGYQGFGLSDIDSRDLGTLETEVNCKKNFMIAWFEPRYTQQPQASVCIVTRSSDYKLTVLRSSLREPVFVVREKFKGRRKRTVTTVYAVTRGHIFSTFDDVLHASTGDLRQVLLANSFKKSYMDGRFSWDAVLNPPSPRDELQEASDYMRLMTTFLNPTPSDAPSQDMSPATPIASRPIPFNLPLEPSPASEPTGTPNEEDAAPTQPQDQVPERS